MSADLYFTGDSFFLSSFFFFRPLISELAERNSTKIGHVIESKCNLKTHVQNLGYPPYKSGAQNHLFGRLRNLTAILTANIYGTKRVYTAGKCVANYNGSAIMSGNDMNFGPQTASN